MANILLPFQKNISQPTLGRRTIPKVVMRNHSFMLHMWLTQVENSQKPSGHVCEITFMSTTLSYKQISPLALHGCDKVYLELVKDQIMPLGMLT